MRQRIRICLVGLAVGLAAVAAFGDVVINEIMYHPYELWGITNNTEYVELYNDGSAAVDLTTYRFDNGVDYAFPPGTMIGPSNYLVVCQDVVAFAAEYPAVSNYVGNFSGGLNNGGERVTLSHLVSNSWVTVDTISYVDIDTSDGDGGSLELVHPGFAVSRDMFMGAWECSMPTNTSRGTPGASNSVYDSMAAPVVGDVKHDPPLPFPYSCITITAEVVAKRPDALWSVKVLYRKETLDDTWQNTNGWLEARMYDNGLNGDETAGDRVFTAVIPGENTIVMTNRTLLEYRILVTDIFGMERRAPDRSWAGVLTGPYSYLCYFGEDTVYDGEYRTYHILMTESNRSHPVLGLEQRVDSDAEPNNVLLDGTLVTADGKVFQNCGIRRRGGSSRDQVKSKAMKGNWRVVLPEGESYDGCTRLTFNWIEALSQYNGHRTFQDMGCYASDVDLARVYLNETFKDPLTSDGIYMRMEMVDHGYTGKRFDDNTGNIYFSDGNVVSGNLAFWPNLSAYPGQYLSEIVNTNTAWYDISNFCWAVNNAVTLQEGLTNYLDMRYWARHYASHVVLDNSEAGMGMVTSFSGDELKLYMEPGHSRLGYGWIFPWDMDATLGSGVVTPEVLEAEWTTGGAGPRMKALMFSTPLRKFYFHGVLDLADNILSDANMQARFREMGTAMTPAMQSTWLANLGTIRASVHGKVTGWVAINAPTGLYTTNVTANRVELRWADNSSNEQWFDIERSTDGVKWKYLTWVNSNTTSYIDRTAKEDRTYLYRIRAQTASSDQPGQSGYSNTGVATTTEVLLDRDLRITEIMYHPDDPDGGGPLDESDVEFIELKNVGAGVLDLTGLYFSDGIEFAFTNNTILDPDEFFVLVANPVAFAARYPGTNYHGVFAGGKLNNGGELLRILDADGQTITQVTFDDGNSDHRWYPTTDGDGYSLVLTDPDGDLDEPSSWRASSYPRGSPGIDDPPSPYGTIVLNEIIAHTDPPLEDAIELYNAGTTTVNIAGWYLSDDPENMKRYQITNSVLNIPAGGYHVFYEGNSFNSDTSSLSCFEIASHGEQVYLSSAVGTNLTSYRTWVKFGASQNGVSFGTYRRSDGVVDFTAMDSRTFGQDNPPDLATFRTGGGLTNSGPKMEPVVINEIMYNPAAGGKEYIELLNTASSNIPLFRLDSPTNTWELSAAVDYRFPPNTYIGPGEHILVVSIDTNEFIQTFGVTCRVFGPFDGSLNNSSETVKLSRPDKPDPSGYVPYILVEKVKYEDKAPWPPFADNGGASLERIDPLAYGNDPANWVAASLGGTPGETNNSAGLPSIAFADPTASGYESNVAVTVTSRVALLPPVGYPVNVEYTVGGTATPGSDFTLTNGALTFLAGQTNKEIIFTVNADADLAEFDETVTITLRNPSAGALLGGNMVYTFTIIDTDPGTITPPTITPAGTNNFTNSISISMSADAGHGIYYTLDGSTPTMRDNLYTGAFTLVTSARIKAKAFKGSYNTSAVKSALVREQAPPFESPPGTLMRWVGGSTDDCYQGAFGACAAGLVSARLTIGSTGSTYAVGVRFDNLDIPDGVVVTNAYIQFTAYDPHSVPVTVTFYGQAADDAPPFAGTGYNITARPATTNTVAWSPQPWMLPGESGPKQQTPDLSAIVNEIRARPGWSPSNAMAFISTFSWTPYKTRTAYSYDGSPAKAAVLCLAWGNPSTNYWLGVATNGPGTITGGNRWVDAGSNATLEAFGNLYYHFAGWSGTIDAGDTNLNPVTVLMDRTRTVTGNFGEDLATNATPHWWLALHGLTNRAWDVEAMDDLDEDGLDAWAEYQAGTDPTNELSVLRIIDAYKSSGNALRWASVQDRTYAIYYSTNLMDGWEPAPLQSGISGTTSGTNNYEDAAGTDRIRFYRVTIE